MAYCVKCGVELEAGAKSCPLCKTPVLLPEKEAENADPLFPPFSGSAHYDPNSVNRSGVMFVLTLLVLIPIVISLLCDVNLNYGVTWSSYVMGALILAYIIVLLPLWFRRPNPVIFTAVDFAAAGAYLLLIDLLTQGGWFLPVAFPIVGGCMLITVTVTALTYYLKRGYLFIFGGAFIAAGFFALLIEFLLNHTFALHQTFVWAIYPLATCLIIGMGLIIIAICRPLRESLRRKFFI